MLKYKKRLTNSPCIILEDTNMILNTLIIMNLDSQKITSEGFWGTEGDYTIYFYVVPEITVNYYNYEGNLHYTKTTVLGNGSTVPYTRTSVVALPANTGYTQKWFTAQTGGTEVAVGAEIILNGQGATKVSDDLYTINLYARAVPNKYTIVYHDNLDGQTATSTHTYDELKNLKKNEFKNEGYSIITRNFRTNYGEIDIIARDKNEIVFIEVKTRSNLKYGNPSEAVNQNKQKHIKMVAKYYIHMHHLYNCYIRFDVIEVYYGKGRYRINHIKQAMDY